MQIIENRCRDHSNEKIFEISRLRHPTDSPPGCPTQVLTSASAVQNLAVDVIVGTKLFDKCIWNFPLLKRGKTTLAPTASCKNTVWKCPGWYVNMLSEVPQNDKQGKWLSHQGQEWYRQRLTWKFSVIVTKCSTGLMTNGGQRDHKMRSCLLEADGLQEVRLHHALWTFPATLKISSPSP